MKDNDTIHIRIAQVLRVIEYSALTVILISLGLEFINIKEAVFGAFAGIGLIVFFTRILKTPCLETCLIRWTG